MVVASWVPPLMAVAMVPVTYLLARKIADWKTGLIAAGLIAVIGSNYAYRSLFGFVDHHIAETLFSTIFVLAYVAALLAARDRSFSPKNFETLKIPVITAALAGIAYLLGYFNMPTMILFALIVAAFTLVQFILDFFEGRSSEYLVLINAVVFGVVIIGAAAFGFPHSGFSLVFYTVGHAVAYAALIAGTLVLYALSVFLKDRPKCYFPAALAAVAALAVAVLYIALPEIYDLLIANLLSFFGTGATTTTVQEARAWSFDAAWATFHWGPRPHGRRGCRPPLAEPRAGEPGPRLRPDLDGDHPRFDRRTRPVRVLPRGKHRPARGGLCRGGGHRRNLERCRTLPRERERQQGVFRSRSHR